MHGGLEGAIAATEQAEERCRWKKRVQAEDAKQLAATKEAEVQRSVNRVLFRNKIETSIR